MRLIDERGRILGITNPIDALVVLALVVVIVGASIALFGTPDEVPAETVSIEFDLLVPDLEAFDSDCIDVGDVVNETTGGGLGTVASVTVETSALYVIRPDGLVADEGTVVKSVRIRVRSEAMITNLGYTVKGMVIRENGVKNIWTTGFQAKTAYITDVEVVQ